MHGSDNLARSTNNLPSQCWAQLAEDDLPATDGKTFSRVYFNIMLLFSSCLI